MNVVFLGTPDFAATCLQALIDFKEINVVAVFTQPDKQVGRKKEIIFSPVKKLAIEKDIPVFQPVKIRDEENLNILRELNPDLIVTAAFGQILSKGLLAIPKKGTINVHGSLLPKYRGSSPIQWAIINGEKVTGITTMFTDVGIDTGDMLLKAEIEIKENETAGELFCRMGDLGAKVLIDTLMNLDTITPTNQNEEESSYYPMLNKEMGALDFNKNADDLVNLIRGLNPWPICYFAYQDKNIKVYEAMSVELKGKPGEILKYSAKEGFIVACGENALSIKTLQAPGKKPMDYKSFINGNKYIVGESLC